MMTTMFRRMTAMVLVTAVAVGACSGSDEPDADSSTTQLTLLPTTTTTLPPSTTSSTTSTTSTTTTSTTTTTTIEAPPTTAANPAIEELLLSGEGIGTAGFGADADGVVEYVASYLGVPANDTGWIDPLTVGICDGDEHRRVSWGVLTLIFGDVSSVVQGRRHFFGYTYGDAGEIGGEPVGLKTTRGVQIGSRVIDVSAAYPAATFNPEDDFTPPFFYVNDSLRGFLTGVEDEATVTAILGGDDCGL
jgi:hypothetical protein